MTSAFWVSMPIIRNIVLAAAPSGKGVATLCAAAGIRPEDLEQADGRLSLEQNCSVMEAALAYSGDPCLGLHIGERTTPVVLGMAGHLIQSCKDLRTALQLVQEHTGAFTRLYRFALETEGDTVAYYCEPLSLWNDLSPETARMSVDLAFAAAVHFLQLLSGRRVRPLRACYTYVRPAAPAEYERVLGCPLRFGTDRNCLVFSASDLQHPVIGYNETLHTVFRTLLEEQAGREQTASVAARVRALLTGTGPEAFPGMEEAARRLHLSPRTLQRKLGEEGTSFRLITDEL
ncbi:MAG TPA: AraC family transcriptional regulator, partial [Chitinophagaceae bacterium]|nr:AraC family transcriptional regulator [Chitinophagaceae bacterium]